jgi:predicted lipoprotein with Yx(FWY)xxD motif
MGTVQGTGPGSRGLLGLRLAGAALLAATGAIHLDLYLTGYRTIPVIGWLFLLQVIAAFLLAVAVTVSGHWLPAAAGAGFALATLAGYLLSVWVGLFGFREVRTTAGIVAGVAEVAAFAALAAVAVAAARQPGPLAAPAFLRGGLDRGGRAVPAAIGGLSVLALALLAVAAAQASGTAAPAASGGGTLKTVRIGGATVLATATGRTLYWFAPDPPNRSVCNSSCAAYWPPVKGPAAAAGVAGRFGTIRRADGSAQATYNGHPLYTYLGDSAAGQATGNNVNLNGGLWHEVTVSG